jgi:uncharacterized protein (DUF4415 family)
MPAKSAATRRTANEPERELPELSDSMLARAVLERGGRRIGRPRSASPKAAISLRLPAEALVRWSASGAGWQTRMAQLLARKAP